MSAAILRPRRSITARAAAALAAAALAVPACGNAEPSAQTEPDAAVVELAAGLTITGLDIDPFQAVSAGCPVLVARGDAAGHRVHLALNGERCADGGDMVAENGNYGDYLSPDDVLAESLVGDVLVSEHPLGTLSAFDHAYVECTNDCVTDVSPMVLLELDDPIIVAEASYPTLLLRSTAMATEELIAIADSITLD